MHIKIKKCTTTVSHYFKNELSHSEIQVVSSVGNPHTIVYQTVLEGLFLLIS